MRKRIITSMFSILLAGSIVLLGGCAKKTSSRSGRSAYIAIENLETDTEPVPAEQGNDTVSAIPVFEVSNGTPTQALDQLNEIAGEVRENYERALSDDKERFTIISDKTEGSRYLLATMYITDDWISLTGKNRQDQNIVTLAYDKQKDLAITSTQALQSTGISGVQLSQRADQQLVKLQERDSTYAGNLRSTEMQGFSLDENGKVNDIYMKLQIDTGKEEPENFFFHFNPDTSELTPLPWPEE